MDDFLQQRHSVYTTSFAEVEALVASVTSRPVVAREKIVRGYDNEVYSVTTSDGAAFIIRIRRYGDLAAHDEAWAIETARAAGAPVPEVLLCDRRFIDGAEREVMIQRLVPGRPFADRINFLDQRQLRRCYTQVAEALARIHSVAVEGFYLRHNGVWDFPTWASIAASNVAARATEGAALVRVGFTDAEFDTLVAALDTLQQRLPWPDPVLLHGDYTPNHWLFDDALQLTGIIDFGQFQGGSPVVDLADLLHGDGIVSEHNCLLWVREGYGPARVWDDFPLRRLAQEIGFCIGSLSYHESIGDAATVAAFVPRIQGLLDAVRAYGIA